MNDYQTAASTLGWAIVTAPVVWLVAACAAGRLGGEPLFALWFLAIPAPAIWVISISVYFESGDISATNEDPNRSVVMREDAAGMPVALHVASPPMEVLLKLTWIRGAALVSIAATGLNGWVTESVGALAISTAGALVFGGWELLRMVGLAAKAVVEDTIEAAGESARIVAVVASGSEETGDAAAAVARGVIQGMIIGELGEDGDQWLDTAAAIGAISAGTTAQHTGQTTSPLLEELVATPAKRKKTEKSASPAAIVDAFIAAFNSKVITPASTDFGVTDFMGVLPTEVTLDSIRFRAVAHGTGLCAFTARNRYRVTTAKVARHMRDLGIVVSPRNVASALEVCLASCELDNSAGAEGSFGGIVGLERTRQGVGRQVKWKAAQTGQTSTKTDTRLQPIPTTKLGTVLTQIG